MRGRGKVMRKLAAWIPVILAVLAGVGFLIKRRLEMPSAIVGWIADPPGAVRVILDNGAQQEDADDISGFFRFERVPLGTHNMRFQHPGYHPASIAVTVRSPGDNYLTQKVRLERVAAGAGTGEPHTAPLQIGTVAVPTRSADGGGPRVPAALVRNLTNGVGSPKPNQSGWVYVGSFDGKEWQRQAIDVGKPLPAEGTVVIARSGVLLWTKQPEERFPSGWETGQVSAVVRPGDTLTLRDVRTDVGKGNVWARVDVGVARNHPAQ